MPRRPLTAPQGTLQVAAATAAAVVCSAAWYAALSRPLGRLHDAYAGDARPPAWVPLIEVGRSATVATAVAVLARRADVRGPAALRLGLGLWAAFPAVLLTGSVVHEKVPWRLAAIHAGDWLVKLLVVSAVTAGRRGR